MHKEKVDKIPNSLPHRSNVEVEIYGTFTFFHLIKPILRDDLFATSEFSPKDYETNPNYW